MREERERERVRAQLPKKKSYKEKKSYFFSFEGEETYILTLLLLHNTISGGVGGYVCARTCVREGRERESQLQ